MAPEAMTGLCSGCSCTGPTPSPRSGTHTTSFSPWSQERPGQDLEAKVFLESCCFPQPWTISAKGGALRAVPLSPHFPAPVLLRQGQPGATSSRKPSQSTSSLPGKGVYLVAPEVPGRDLDPACSVQMTLRTSGFSSTLPCLSFPFWEGSVFTHRGWN